MKFCTFYILDEKYQTTQKNNYLEQLVCRITLTQWRSGKTIFIACNNKIQAIKIDTELWKFDKNSFLPHNLYGKNTYNSPIIIYWIQCCYDNNPKTLLINLTTINIHFSHQFNEIIDFVPTSNILKKLARNRYQYYKKTGFQLYTTNA